MSEPEIPQDTVVETALRLLPVPQHTDDFWARLDQSLTDAGAPAEASPAVRPLLVVAPYAGATPEAPPLELEADPALALVPGTLRRRSNAVLVAVAAAAVVVVALAGNTLLEERSGTEEVASDDQPQADGQLDALVEDAQAGGSERRTLSGDGQDASSAAVLAWVDDLSSGDGDGAWAAMGPISRGYFGSQDAFEEQMASLAEGYGAWAGAEPDQVLVTPMLSSDEGTLAVVTLVGTSTMEGRRQKRAEAFPVRVIGDEAHLEPFAFAGELEVVVPEGVPTGGQRPAVPEGEELVIVVPSGAEAPLLRLDDGETLECGRAEGTELSDLEDADGQRCAYLPDGGIESGEHTLTVAFLSSDGTEITAESLLFEAA